MPLRWRRDPVELAEPGVAVTRPPCQQRSAHPRITASYEYRQAKPRSGRRREGSVPGGSDPGAGSDHGGAARRGRVAAAAQAGDHAGQAAPAGIPAGQEPAHGVEGTQRVLEVGRVLRLRPGGELHADRVGTPADVQHLAVDAQAEQYVAVVARAEPELVPV